MATISGSTRSGDARERARGESESSCREGEKERDARVDKGDEEIFLFSFSFNGMQNKKILTT